MASVTKTAAEVKYVLEMSKREAEALTEMLVVVDSEEGEGAILDGIYHQLHRAGCESFTTSSKIENGIVIVERDDE